FFFWPRRELRELRTTLGATFAALGPALRDSLESFRTGRTDPLAAVDTAIVDERLARDSYRVYVDETANRPVPKDGWGGSLAVAGPTRGGRGVVPPAGRRFPGLEHDPAFAALTTGADRIAATLGGAAATIETGTAPPPAGTLDAVTSEITPAVVAA